MFNCCYKCFKHCFKNWFVQHFAQANIKKLFLNFFSLILKKTNITFHFPLKFLACFVHSLLCQLALYFSSLGSCYPKVFKEDNHTVSYSLFLGDIKCCFVGTQMVRTCVCRVLHWGKWRRADRVRSD